MIRTKPVADTFMSQDDEKTQPGGAVNGQPVSGGLGEVPPTTLPAEAAPGTGPATHPAPAITITIPAEQVAPLPQRLPPPRPVAMVGRRYGFLCSYCSSRLEAVESMAGQSGTCPTCGKSIVIPIL